jgi:MFS family permease
MLSFRHITIYIGGFSGPVGGLAVLALISVLEHDFSVDVEMIQWSVPFFMLPFALFQFFSGTLSDKLGRGGIIIGGFLVHSMGSIICAVSPDWNAFLGGRFVQGVGYAFVSPVLTAMIGDITPGRRMGSAMGIFGAAITLGIATGPLIAGFLEPIDWRLAFFLFAALSLVEIGLLFAAFGKRFTVQKGKVRALSEELGKVVRNRSVLLLSGAGFLTFFGYIGAQFYMSEHLGGVFEAREIGYILSSAGFVGVFWAPVAGRFVDSIGRRPVGVAGFTLLTVSIIILAWAGPLWSYIGIFCLMGLATSSIWAVLLTLSVELVPRMKGTVSSIFNSMRFLGYAVSTPLLLLVFLGPGLHIVYVVGAFATILGLIMLKGIRFREPADQGARYMPDMYGRPSTEEE